MARNTLGLGTHPATDQVTFPLQQTACPAIVIEFPSIAQVDEELRLGAPWYQRQQAYAVLRGVLTHYGRPAPRPWSEYRADS